MLNFKVGDQALPKEVVDAIMAENGRDIEAGGGISTSLTHM